VPDHLHTSGFESLLLPMLGRDGREHVVAIVRAAFLLDASGQLAPDPEQTPVRLEDVHAGDPGVSGPVEECDLALYKPGTDIVVVGEAHAPRGRRTGRVTVRVEVGALAKSAHVIGDREWRRWLGFGPLRPTAPRPFTRMPLLWERSAGGTDPRTATRPRPRFDERNPAGCGYRSGLLRLAKAGQALPNVLRPEPPSPILRSNPEPWGFGPVGRHWWPRRRLAGTYDKAWEDERAPLLPDDFDYRYFQCGSSNLVSRGHLQGDEPVRLVHLSPEGRNEFRLPGLRLGMTVFRPGRPRERAVGALDTIVLEPSRRRVSLVWRRAFPCARSASEISRVVSFVVTRRGARAALGERADQPVEEPAWTS